MIDLHLHTTASDGRLRPETLVARAAQAGLRVLSVTDHDTVAGLAEAREAARTQGLRLVNGIEHEPKGHRNRSESAGGERDVRRLERKA